MLDELEIVYQGLKKLIGNPIELKCDLDEELPKELPEENKETVIVPLKYLKPSLSDWTVRVRLTNKGQVKLFKRPQSKSNDRLLSLEFIDREGTKITGILFRDGITTYERFLQIGNCYQISKGQIKVANKKYTSVEHEYCITLDESSLIERIPDDPLIKQVTHNFAKLLEIQELPIEKLVDIIGIVDRVGEVTSAYKSDEGFVDRRSVHLYDEDKQLIELTLWRSLAKESLARGQIIGVRNVRIGEFNGRRMLNTLHETQIIPNPADPRLAALEILARDVMSQTTSPVKPLERFREKAVLIAELESFKKEATERQGYYVINAMVIGEKHEGSIVYRGCKNCKRKVQDVCKSCGANAGTKFYFSFGLEVTDGTGKMQIRLLGNSAEKLLGVAANSVTDESAQRQLLSSIRGKVLFSNFLDVLVRNSS
eukprot:TRINITY_DN7860_c0_g1_i2.p1 TRINITY_DN7860_c0_g1~~TRINITY_DN7860_c0_g1_i2.p1  ORF type:complete len:426 (+),score=73.15 TRINITY_DN7860_c0_g1_i2:275-1552(+)